MTRVATSALFLPSRVFLLFAGKTDKSFFLGKDRMSFLRAETLGRAVFDLRLVVRRWRRRRFMSFGVAAATLAALLAPPS